MPRETIDVTRFIRGMISGIDPTDIPPDAAKESLEIDPDTYPGELTQRQDEKPRQTSTAHGYHMRTGGKFIWRGDTGTTTEGDKDLCYYQDSTGQINVIKDWPTGTSDTSAVSGLSTGKTVSIQPHRECCYVGWGSDSTSAAKWVGYIPYGQFGNSAAYDTLRGLDAACAPPGYFPQCYRTVTNETYIWGIEWKGQYIYRITVADGTVVRSAQRFTSLQGIVLEDSTHLIVLDYVSRPGTLIRIENITTTMSIADQTMLTYNRTKDPYIKTEGGGYSKNLEPCDLAISKSSTTTYLWMAWYSEDDLAAPTDTSNRFQLYVMPKTNLWDATTFTGYTALGLPMATANSPTGNLGKLDANYAGTTTYKLKKTPFLRRTRAATLPAKAEIAFLVNVTCRVFIQTSPSTDSVVPGDMVFFFRHDATYANVTEGGLGGWDSAGTSYHGEVGSFWFNGSYNLVQLCAGQPDGSMLTDENPIQIIALDSNNAVHPIWTIGTTTALWYNYVDGTNDTYKWGAGGGGIVAHKKSATATNEKYSFDNISEGALCCVGGATGDPTETYYFIVDNTLVSYNWRPRGVNIAFEGTGAISTTRVKSSSLIIRLQESINSGSFSTSKRYWYRASLIYDGLQESPLNVDTYVPYISSLTGTQAVQVSLTLYDVSNWLSARVSGINIYRAEGTSTDETPTSFYRLAGQVSLAQAWANVTGETGWTGTAYGWTFTDIGVYGVAFESGSGIPETLTDSNVNYELSAQYGGYLFVGRCYHSAWTDARHTIFRSRPNAFSTFNALTDYVVLPTIPTAMAAWNGYLYVFDEHQIYRINTATLGVEDILEGAGAKNQDAVCVTDQGIYFADTNNIYLFNGNLQRIGDAIVRNATTAASSHTGLMAAHNCSILTFNKMNGMLFLYTAAGATPKMFFYHLKTDSWHYWTMSTTVTDATYSVGMSGALGGFTDIDGQVYVGAGTGGTHDTMVSVCGSTTQYKVATWKTPDFPLDDHSQQKKFYGAQVNGTVGSTTLTYDKDLSGSYSSLSAKAFFKSLSVQIYLNSTSSRQRVKAFSLVFRRMIGKRL